MAESAAALHERAQPKPKPARPMFRFTIPVKLQGQGVTEVGLVQLTSNEELQATKRAVNDTHRLAYELAKESLREVDGNPVGAADGSIDAVWKDMHPKIRTLIMTAYGELHAPEKDEIDSFLQSQRVEVG